MSYTPHTREHLEDAADRELGKVESARARARRRRMELRVAVARDLRQRAYLRLTWWQRLRGDRAYVSDRVIDIYTDFRASEDPQWRAAVEDDKFHGRQLVEYSALAALKDQPR